MFVIHWFEVAFLLTLVYFPRPGNPKHSSSILHGNCSPQAKPTHSHTHTVMVILLSDWTQMVMKGVVLKLQSGCCKPPTLCGYTFVNPTYWTGPNNTAADLDCLMWSNEQTQLCYACESCKAGLLASLRSEWRRADLILAVTLVGLICVYLIGCCWAFSCSKREEDPCRRHKQRHQESWNVFTFLTRCGVPCLRTFSSKFNFPRIIAVVACLLFKQVRAAFGWEKPKHKTMILGAPKVVWFYFSLVLVGAVIVGPGWPETLLVGVAILGWVKSGWLSVSGLHSEIQSKPNLFFKCVKKSEPVPVVGWVELTYFDRLFVAGQPILTHMTHLFFF